MSSFTHSLTHSLTHPLFHSPTRSLTDSLTHSLKWIVLCTGGQPAFRSDTAPKRVQVQVAAEPVERDIAGRLSQLERLQYELTRQVPQSGAWKNKHWKNRLPLLWRNAEKKNKKEQATPPMEECRKKEQERTGYPSYGGMRKKKNKKEQGKTKEEKQ